MTDWTYLRKQFPVTKNSTYLNTAAAGPLAVQTAQAATEYYNQMLHDGDIHWDAWLARREEVRAEVAAFINAEPDEIGFTTNTSSGMSVIIDALETHGEVISSELEFPVSTIPWMHRRIPVHPLESVGGEIPIEKIKQAMNERTGVLSFSYVQFSNGFRLDLEELGSLKGKHAFVVNASQAAGVFEIDVKRMKIDALCATGHKWMRSGYGSGFVYLSREVQSRSHARSIGWLSVEDPYAMRNNEIHLRHDMSGRTELGCPHFAGIFALGASVQMMREIGVKNIQDKVLELNRRLTTQLDEAGWEVLSPVAKDQSRSAETLVKAESPRELVSVLSEQSISVTEKPQGIRIATDFFNNEEDIDRLIAALKKF